MSNIFFCFLYYFQSAISLHIRILSIQLFITVLANIIETHIYKTWPIFCCKFLGSFYPNKRSPKRSIKEEDSRYIDHVEALRAPYISRP